MVVGGSSPALAVANSEPVPEGRYRFAVRLTMPDITRPDGTHYSSACSAALVAPGWIVGAGHCFHDGARNPINGPVRYPVVATIGTTDLNSGNGAVVDVVEVFQAGTTDLALARLAAPVTSVAPLRIGKAAPAIGETVRIAGWGWTGTGEFGPSSVLRTGQFQVTSVTETTIGVVGFRPLPSTSACAYDSGAPYFVERNGVAHLVSVESTGPDCPHDQEETTARADNLREWMKRVIGR